VPAIAGLLKDTGLSMKDIDLVEINEAFAPQVVACVNALKKDHNIELPIDKLNVNGSGISLGHPIGATGGRILANLMNELQRVLKKGAKCQLVMPHWASNRAYADLRFQYPPVAESWFFSLNEDYRKQDPNFDKRYKCNFDFTCGYSLHPQLVSRNQEYQQHAITFWKEAAQDLIATIIKK
jgi:hypothetical protein